MREVLLAVAFFLGLASGVQAACADHKIWEGILKANVSPDGWVDYDAIRINKGGDLLEYIAYLEDASLAACTDAEKSAFWINAYNAHFVRLALARPQMKSVSEDFRLFGEKFKIASRDLSLNQIQHRVLRSSPKSGGPVTGLSLPAFDPRLHFALVYGSVDNPRLLNRAYNAPTLEDQLQKAAADFANDPARVRLEGGKLVLPSFLRWYADDFSAVGGVGAYLASLTDAARRPDEKDVDALLTQDYPSNADFRFDWTLNARTNKPK